MTAAQNRFANIFRELGASIGADIMPDEHGVVTLSLGDDVALSIEVPQDSAFIYFHSPVQRLTGADRARELEAAMRKNLFGLSVSGAWLALDSASDELLLCYSALGEDVTADTLANLIEALGEAVRDLRAEAAAPPEGIPADGGNSLSADDDFIRV